MEERRQVVRQREKEESSALLIQSMARRKEAMVEVEKKRQEKKEQEAEESRRQRSVVAESLRKQEQGAIALQSLARQKQAKKAVEAKREAVQQEASAIAIQNVARQKAAKKEVSRKKEAQAREQADKAATRIQASVRGRLASSAQQKRRESIQAEAVTKLQRQYRRRVAQRDFKTMLDCHRDQQEKIRQGNMLPALPGTIQGQSGWYSHPQNKEICVFCEVSPAGEWTSLLGPIALSHRMQMIRDAKSEGFPVYVGNYVDITDMPDYYIDGKGALLQPSPNQGGEPVGEEDSAALAIQRQMRARLATKTRRLKKLEREMALKLQRQFRRRAAHKDFLVLQKTQRMKEEEATKNNMLLALPGTTQGQTGWYTSPQNKELCIYSAVSDDGWDLMLNEPIQNSMRVRMLRDAKKSSSPIFIPDYIEQAPKLYMVATGHLKKEGEAE